MVEVAEYSKPLHRDVLTKWRLHTESESFSGQAVITPTTPSEEHSTARYDLSALILVKANSGRGEHKRIGYQPCTKRSYVQHLRQACRTSNLPEDLYLERPFRLVCLSYKSHLSS